VKILNIVNAYPIYDKLYTTRRTTKIYKLLTRIKSIDKALVKTMNC